MSKLRVLVDGEWLELESDAVEFLPDDADELGEVVDAEPVIHWTNPPVERPLDESQRRREMLRSQAAWGDDV